MINRESVLITGSSRGIGRELALVFAHNNYNIILHGRDSKNLIKTWGEVQKKGVDVSIVEGDLRQYSTLEGLCEKAKEKDISILINNAGVKCPGLSLERINEEKIEEILAGNLTQLIILTQKIYKWFLEKGHGTIININSMSGLKARQLRTIYSASKWGLRGFTDCLRLEAKPHNIKIIGAYLGMVKTAPGDEKGMNAHYVAQKIYENYIKDVDEIIL